MHLFEILDLIRIRQNIDEMTAFLGYIGTSPTTISGLNLIFFCVIDVQLCLRFPLLTLLNLFPISLFFLILFKLYLFPIKTST